MADQTFDPATGAGQATNPQVQQADTHQGIFGGSNDVFNNPDMFQVAAPDASKPQEEFHLDFDQLEANQGHSAAPVEPEIIEPQKQETRDEYQAKQTIPEPVIIEQVIEPEMKPEVVVNPRKAPVQQAVQPKPVPQATTVPAPKPAPTPVVPTPQPRPVQAPVQQPVQPKPVAPVQQVKPQIPQAKPVQITTPTPVSAPKPEPVQAVKVPEIQETAPRVATSDLQKKLNELVGIANNIYTLEKKESDETLEILGANNDKVTILYQITLPENGIMMKKIETDTAQEELVNDLGFILDTDTNSVQIILDDVLLFDEIEHLQDDAKKKMQVTEKLNKFIFLLGEHQKKIAKEAKEKEQAEQERRRLQDIFRNF